MNAPLFSSEMNRGSDLHMPPQDNRIAQVRTFGLGAKTIQSLAFGMMLSVLAPASIAGTYRIRNDLAREASDQTTTVQHHGAIEVGFSPHEGAEKLVLKAIDSARSEIRVLSYSFTSAPVVRALLDARHRGVDVALIVDYKNNIEEDRSGKAGHALGALINAGCRVRTISIYPIHHDKSIIVDRRTVETGSFNYSDAAANKNSENVIVIWDNPDLASVYLKHWADRFGRGDDLRTGY